jgi:hypothetical protein
MKTRQQSGARAHSLEIMRDLCKFKFLPETSELDVRRKTRQLRSKLVQVRVAEKTTSAVLGFLTLINELNRAPRVPIY